MKTVGISAENNHRNHDFLLNAISSVCNAKHIKSAAGVMLAPANAAYTPQMYGPDTLDDIQIEGKAIGWIHWV